MNHPKNDRRGAIRRAEGKVRADHQRRPAASSIAPSAGLCLDCLHHDGGCDIGGKPCEDCEYFIPQAFEEPTREEGENPPGWRCPKCGSLTDGDECQYCGW